MRVYLAESDFHDGLFKKNPDSGEPGLYVNKYFSEHDAEFQHDVVAYGFGVFKLIGEAVYK